MCLFLTPSVVEDSQEKQLDLQSQKLGHGGVWLDGFGGLRVRVLCL